MKRIVANNEIMKQEMYIHVVQELLPNEEDARLFKKAKVFLHDTTREAMFLPYLKLVEKIVNDIDAYLLSYLELCIDDKKNLKEDYICLIGLGLEELRLHVDFLPFYEESPLR